MCNVKSEKGALSSAEHKGRIVVVTAGGDNANIMINALAARFTNVAILQEEPESKALFVMRRARKLGWVMALGQLATMFVSRIGKRFTRRRAAEILRENDASAAPNRTVPVHRVDSINDADGHAMLQLLKPAVLFLISCRMLKPETLAAVNCPILNFHAGTTGAVAKRLGRHFVGIEREQDYIDAAAERIAAVEPLGKATLSVMTGKKAEPRVAFNTLVESGLIKPGTVLTDAKRRYSAIVRADGTLASGGEAGSIHRLGAKVQGLDACNGWTFWHFEEGSVLKPIDELRSVIRNDLAKLN